MRDPYLDPERFELHEPPAYVFAPDRRLFLGISGAGLLFLVAEPTAWAQRPTPGDTTLQARLHLGEDGQVTILSGKVEEGQGPRTELAMAAAEELRLPVSRITVTLADTARTPNDGTTAGSRTTPATVPAVRRAAATARELLALTAARQFGGASSAVRIQDGVATVPGFNGKLTYRDLARSADLAKAYSQPLPAESPLTPSRDWQVLGKSQNRTNARDIVTGLHKYPADIERPNMLYGAVLRPPSYGATLQTFDPKSASAAGSAVSVVRDGEFAGCVAPTSYQARKAVQALAATAKWQTREHPSSDKLFDHLKQHAAPADKIRANTRGDVDGALAASAKRIKATYRASYVQHAPMEPRAAVAEWEDGRLTVWTGTSNPFAVREALAQAFRIPADSIRVIVPDFGGGFGGKHTGEAALEAARLARETKRPVSLRWTRAEEFTWAYARPAALIEVDAALDAAGAVHAWDFTNYNSGTAAIDTPYRAPNVRTRYIPSDSPLRQGSYRALASTANNFARESVMDELAALAGADPLEFRLANLANDRIRTVLTAAAERFNWNQRRKERRTNRGIGLSCGTEKNSVVAACVEVEVDPKSGVPRLIEICEAYECGAILNPVNLSAQVEGCILMGLGAALREELLFENGQIKNARFSGYKVPRFRDVPKMDVVLVDRKNAEPIGAGETPIIAVAPAMGNAIFHATGQRYRSLPLRPGSSSS